MLKGHAGAKNQPSPQKAFMGLTAVFLTYFLSSLMTFGQNIAAQISQTFACKTLKEKDNENIL